MLTAEQFLTLKEKLQEEVLRRNACGSLAVYVADAGEAKTARIATASGSGDTTEPSEAETGAGEQEVIEAGDVILAKDGRKVIEPILAIQDYGDLVFPEPGERIPASFDESLITYVNTLSEEPMTGTTTSCRGACTGLCMKGCSNACSGCTGSCTGCGGCSASCGTGCASGSRA